MFFDNYKDLCKKKNKTPTAVALELGIGRSTVSYWRNGNTPKQKILIKLSNYFDVSVDYLLGKVDKKEESTPVTDNKIDEELVDLIIKLNSEEISRLKGFAAGLLANRE